MNELEEMRRDLQLLKDKVEKRGVLNERLVRQFIKGKISNVRTLYTMIVMML